MPPFSRILTSITQQEQEKNIPRFSQKISDLLPYLYINQQAKTKKRLRNRKAKQATNIQTHPPKQEQSVLPIRGIRIYFMSATKY